jgi:hypothetical protein
LGSAKVIWDKLRVPSAVEVNSMMLPVLLHVNFALRILFTVIKGEDPRAWLVLLVGWRKKVVQNVLDVGVVRLATVVKIAPKVNIVQANIQAVRKSRIQIPPHALIAKSANSCPIKVPQNAWIVSLDNFKTKKEIKNAKNVPRILLQPAVKKSPAATAPPEKVI